MIRPVIRGRLARVSQSIRTVMRCLGGNKESQESAQRATLILCELLDMLCQLQDQLSWADEKWVVDPSRLHTLDELIRCFESTVGTIEMYFQPGGISTRSLRKRLLEVRFIPRLEHFKAMMILAMQPESRYVLPSDLSGPDNAMGYVLRLMRVFFYKEESPESKKNYEVYSDSSMRWTPVGRCEHVSHVGALAENQILRFNNS